MALKRLNAELFLDTGALVFVRFEKVEDDLTAFLQFREGATQIVKGDQARQLLHYLSAPEDVATQAGSHPPDIQVAGQAGASAHRFLNGLPFPASEFGKPVLGRTKIWVHRRDDQGKEYFLAFVNAKGSCSVRTFDERGLFLGKHYHSGNYQDEFRDLLDGGTELIVPVQPNLERDCRQRLPESLLEQLRQQLNALMKPE